MRTLSQSLFFIFAIGVSSVTAKSQTLGPDFAPYYTVVDLFSAPGVPSGYGGMTFKASDPNKLLIVGEAETANSKIYEIGVTRDTDGHIDGWSGTATLFATTPYATGGLIYAPNGVLLYTTYDDLGVFDNLLGQIKPGSIVADKLFDLDGLVCPSTGGIALTPASFANPGSFKITSYDCDTWYDADLVDDGTGMGLFDVVNASGMALPVAGGASSSEHVDTTYTAFSAKSVLTMDWYNSEVSAYQLDANGDPDTTTRRVFLEAASGYFYLGSTTDQQTGDWLIGDSGSGDHVFVVMMNPLGGSIGTNYCGPANLNSTGMPGVISAVGSPFVADNFVDLTSSQLPANQIGYYITSQTKGFIPFPGGSQGSLCLSGSIGRYSKFVRSSGSTGVITMSLDLTQTPQPSGLVSILPGETWNWQLWHSDKGGTNNFTDGISILFK